MKKLIKNEITINADKKIIWDALTQSEYTQQYMYGCSPITTWEVGSDLLWNANVEDKEITFVKGKVKEVEPFKKIEYTVFDPNASYPNTIENHLIVTYTLQEVSSNKTILKVSQGDFSKVQDGEKRYRDVIGDGEGWRPILQKIKSIVENQP